MEKWPAHLYGLRCNVNGEIVPNSEQTHTMTFCIQYCYLFVCLFSKSTEHASWVQYTGLLEDRATKNCWVSLWKGDNHPNQMQVPVYWLRQKDASIFPKVIQKWNASGTMMLYTACTVRALSGRWARWKSRPIQCHCILHPHFLIVAAHTRKHAYCLTCQTTYLGGESRARFVINMTNVRLHRLLSLYHYVLDKWDKCNPILISPVFTDVKYRFGSGVQVFEAIG